MRQKQNIYLDLKMKPALLHCAIDRRDWLLECLAGEEIPRHFLECSFGSSIKSTMTLIHSLVIKYVFVESLSSQLCLHNYVSERDFTAER